MIAIQWYVAVITLHYFDFKGRARRSEFWYFTLVNLVVAILLSLLDVILGMELLGDIYGLASLLPSTGVSVRRLHDVGKSGWLVLLFVVPIIARIGRSMIVDEIGAGLIAIVVFAILIYMTVLFAKRGTIGPNQYGSDPKEAAPQPPV